MSLKNLKKYAHVLNNLTLLLAQKYATLYVMYTYVCFMDRKMWSPGHTH